jgi:hypothetical protein
VETAQGGLLRDDLRSKLSAIVALPALKQRRTIPLHVDDLPGQ